MFNEVVYSLGILATTLSRRNDVAAGGVEIAVEYVKAMRDAEL
jgi:hypothetical protein